jgi:hypothetical protein
VERSGRGILRKLTVPETEEKHENIQDILDLNMNLRIFQAL